MSVIAVLERLAPHIEREVNIVINSKQQADSLTSKLKKVQDGLLDAERRSVMDKNVRNWLKDVERLMFEMEDVLDEWEALDLSQSEDRSSSNPWEKITSVISCLCSCFQRDDNVFWRRREVILNMQNLSGRLDQILEEKNKYDFVSGESNHNRSEETMRVESTGHLDRSRVHLPRELEQQKLLRVLLSEDEDGGSEMQIISIVGVGGVGKTTLAQLVYNHPEVKDHFDSKAWAFVGDPFEPTKIARSILEDIDTDKGMNSNKPSTLNGLIGRIKQIIGGNRFLLVLDDVWEENSESWEELKKCLIEGGPRSRVLVTTRNEGVARMMETRHCHQIGLLSDEDCGLILNGIALHGRSDEERQKLEGIGVEIAKKCNGLPLAAKAIGSMLALKASERDWRYVLENPLWKNEDKRMTNLFRLLKLSYIELDPVLKRCFLCCANVPKGGVIYSEHQIRDWSALGYIRSINNSEDEVKRKGYDYFEQLTMRSFVEKLDYDDDYKSVRFKMHDIMHDFASYMLENDESFFMMESDRRRTNPAINSLERLRGFYAWRISQEQIPPNLFSHLKSVRVLLVLGCGLHELPPCIGALLHLRFLDLSWNPIVELPSTLTDLYHLESLDVQGCKQLVRLPQGIEKLKKLRHLIVHNTPNLREFPQGLQKLTNLRTLGRFHVGGEEGGSKLGWLENLNELQGSLIIEISAADEEDAKKANLSCKTGIQHLELHFGVDVRMEVILEALQPPPGIQTLKIVGCGGKWFPSWLTTNSNSLLKLEELTIGGFNFALPSLYKLPRLQKLYIGEMKFERLGLEFFGMDSDVGAANNSSRSALGSAGRFSKLKTLGFSRCRSWEEWEDTTGDDHDQDEDDILSATSEVLLPCLEELYFYKCSKLKRLPHNLLCTAKSLRYLGFQNCEYLKSRYEPECGIDWDKVSHIPRVEVLEDEDEDKE